MSFWTSVRDSVEGVAAPVASAVAVGMPAAMISSGAAAATGLAGMLGLGGQQPLPQPGSGGGGGVSAPQDEFGSQQNLAGLMNMIGQQQPSISMTGGTLGGGGLI